MLMREKALAELPSITLIVNLEIFSEALEADYAETKDKFEFVL